MLQLIKPKQKVTMKKLLLLLVPAAVIPLAANAQITYSGLEGLTLGGFDATTDGQGWHSDGWTIQNDGIGHVVDNTNPLVFGGLPTSTDGNYFRSAGGYQNAGRRLDTGPGSAWANAGYVSSPASNARIDQGGEVWASFLTRRDNDTGGDLRVLFHSNPSPWNPGADGFELQQTGSGNWTGGMNGGTLFDSGVAGPIGSVQMALVRLNFSGEASSVHAWIFNDWANVPATAPTLDTAQVSLTDLNAEDISFHSIHFYGANSGGNSNGAFDEIRLDPGYTSVIPEPGTYAAFAGLLALGLMIYRRRR